MEKLRFTNQSTASGSTDINIVQQRTGFKVVNNRSAPTRHAKLAPVEVEKSTLVPVPFSEPTSEEDEDIAVDEAPTNIPVKHLPRHSPKVVDDSFKDFINSNKRRMRTPTPTTPPPVVAPTDHGDASSHEDTYSDEDFEDDGSDASDVSFGEQHLENADDTPTFHAANAAGTVNDIKKSSSQVCIGMNSTQHKHYHETPGGGRLAAVAIPPPPPEGGQQASMDDPNRPSEGFSSIEEEKVDMLFKLDRMKRKNFKVRQLDDTSSIVDIRKEYNRIKNELELDHSINFSRKVLMAVVSTIEFLNKKYDPFDLALNGWSESVMENINSYDNVLERLYYKYRSKVAMPPELELMITLAGSAFMFHMTNSLFKSMASSLGGPDGPGRNPDLLQSMMSAFANIASKAGSAAPPPQEAASPATAGPSSRVNTQPPVQPVSPAAASTAGASVAPHAAPTGWPAGLASTAGPGVSFNASAPLRPSVPTAGGNQYKMRGPDIDLNSVMSGPASMLPNLMGMLGGGLDLPPSQPHRPATTQYFVAPNPISSNSVNLPRRAIEIEDDRFVNNAEVRLPSEAAPSLLNRASGVVEPHMNRERPFLPEPPKLVQPLHQAISPDVQATKDTAVTSAGPTPAFLDDDRLSDIISDDLESIRTDALDTVMSEDEAHAKTVTLTRAPPARSKGRTAMSGSKAKSSSSGGNASRRSKATGKVIVL